jgi:AcrR family transcriptional regulator
MLGHKFTQRLDRHLMKTTKGLNKADYRPRKIPHQKRSQVLFDCILNTAKTLFQQEGYAYVSTNQIADSANISIGSIYKYFANCESIALAIYEEASARATLQMKRRASEILRLPLQQSTIELLSTFFDIFEKDQFVLLQLIDEVPELREAAQAVSFDNLIHQTTLMYFQLHYPEVPKKIIAEKAYLIEKSVIGTIRRYLEEQPDYLSPEELVSELATMTQLYLTSIIK